MTIPRKPYLIQNNNADYLTIPQAFQYLMSNYSPGPGRSPGSTVLLKRMLTAVKYPLPGICFVAITIYI
jgi:hypothetical protein